MEVKIKILKKCDEDKWDNYLLSGKRGNLYLLSGWKKVIEKTYRHKTYYLTAYKESCNKIVGILPLVHLNHFLFGNSLVSIPYFDMGGVFADDSEIEIKLIKEAVKIGRVLKADLIELRHLNKTLNNDCLNLINCFAWKKHCDKVRMVITLPDSSKTLMKSFKSKLRSQIKKPVKHGLHAIIGGIELTDQFYDVFLVNMRDLGSPVHSKELINNVLKTFEPMSRIVIVKKGNTAVAASVICAYKNIMMNPWSSALRRFNHLSANMLLYWTMLEYSCDNGFEYFDFGRSTPGEGTFRFKKQWGAVPVPLNWYFLSLGKYKQAHSITTDRSKFFTAVKIWQKLPLFLTAVFGPMIRKHIAL